MDGIKGRNDMKHKINMTFDVFTLRQPVVANIIQKSIQTALEMQGIDTCCELNVLITNDRGIRTINKASRNIDKETDVLSFPMFTLTPGQNPESWEAYLDPETGVCPLGDIAISLERAAAQAKEFGHSLKREIGYLTIHSVLHLLGYDHLDEGPQKAQMRSREEAIAAYIGGMNRT